MGRGGRGIKVQVHHSMESLIPPLFKKIFYVKQAAY